MLTPITAAITVVLAIILVQALVGFGCYCAISKRFHYTLHDRFDLIIACAWFLYWGIWLKHIYNADASYEELEELVTAYFVYGYSKGQADARLGCETCITNYVRRHRSVSCFVPMTQQLITYAYNEGQRNVRQS